MDVSVLSFCRNPPPIFSSIQRPHRGARGLCAMRNSITLTSKPGGLVLGHRGAAALIFHRFLPAVLILLACLPRSTSAQTGQWIWLGGSNKASQTGTFGTLGVSASANTPGSRAEAVVWTDKNGALWLSEGGGFAAESWGGELNDVWKFNLVTNEWTWMGGSNSVEGPIYANGGQ